MEPERTAVTGDIRVTWTSVEDGGPTVYLWYRSSGPRPHPDPTRWTALGFGKVLLFGYHNEHLIAEDRRSSYEKALPGYPWALRVARDSEYKEWAVSRLTTVGPGGQPNWCGMPPEDLLHYRLIHDHDGIYDIIASDVEISHGSFPVDYESVAAPPWLA